MRAGTTDPGVEDRIRETYEEYDVDGVRVGLIGDPRNEHAWVQSDHVHPIER